MRKRMKSMGGVDEWHELHSMDGMDEWHEWYGIAWMVWMNGMNDTAWMSWMNGIAWIVWMNSMAWIVKMNSMAWIGWSGEVAVCRVAWGATTFSAKESLRESASHSSTCLKPASDTCPFWNRSKRCSERQRGDRNIAEAQERRYGERRRGTRKKRKKKREQIFEVHSWRSTTVHTGPTLSKKHS